MITTFILGNGFDLNLGLKTRYEDFYEYYCSVKSNSEVIENLKSNISDSISELTKKTSDIDWSDMELGLGAYTKNLSTEEDVDIIYEDLRKNLRAFINQEKKRISKTDMFDIDTLKEDLMRPERFLPKESQNEIQDFRKLYLGGQNNILSFNYTESIEKLLSTADIAKGSIIIQNNLHIHRLTDKIIFGVNDVSQIANKELAKKEYVRNLLIKPLINGAYRDSHIQNCTNLIERTNLICMFGVSMGDTDRFWWDTIRSRMLASSTKLIFYQFISDDEYRDYSNDAPHQLLKENSIRKEIMKKMGFSSIDESLYRSRIYIDIMKREDHIFNIGSV